MISDQFKELISAELKEYEDCLGKIDGIVTFRLASPCPDLGILQASVMDKEIIISIKSFHTHIDQCAVEDKGAISIASLAVGTIKQIIEGEYFFTETHKNNIYQSSGGGPARLDSKTKNLLAHMYGKGTVTKEWNWFGVVQ